MKFTYRLFLQIVLILPCVSVLSQTKEKVIHFANGDFITQSNISNHTFTKSDISTALAGNDYYVLLQFNVLPSAEVKQKMKTAGIQLSTYLPDNGFLASIKNSFDFNKAAGFQISSINSIPAMYKIHKKLLAYRASGDKELEQVIAVNYFEQADQTMVLESLKKAGAAIVSTKFTAGFFILIQYNPAVINNIAALPFVSSLGLQPVKDKALNYNSRAASGTGGLNAANGKNLNGKGVTIGVGDNAEISNHIDFAGRLINRCPWVPEFHGMHTSGTAAGAGIVNVKNRGMAAKATIVSQYFSDIIVNTPAYIADYNMVLTNNSYHAAEAGCNGEQEYNSLSAYADQQIINNNQLLHVFAAGNDGDITCAPYPLHFGTIKSGWQCAKNILTVGALIVSNNSIASYSSRGPAQDGRIKPEISADGYAVLSTNVNNSYALNSGTSMACPAVTGSLTLMYERYRQIHGGANPKSALIKAIACNTAEDLGNAGPDYSFGFGMLNTRRAVEAIDSSRYFISNMVNGGSNTHNITIPPNTRRLKIMLYWADAPAAPNASTALVNDLDMVVIEPSFTLHRPLTLNSTAASVTNIATEAPDHINNIEQVVIENPAAGIYSANINGYNIAQGSQEYVVSYEVVQSGVTVEYPYGGESWVPGETESIRWNAYGNESNTFTLEYSTDNGANWILIDNSVAASTRVYPFVVPAIQTNNALVRISRNGTALSDQSNFNFNILGQPTVTTTNVCEGAVQLDWSAVAGATSYDILLQSGDSMQVIGNTSSLSYLLTGLNRRKTYWLGVAAKNNIVAGRRSISVAAIPNSGTCALANFNNDLKTDSIVEPASGRQFFSSAVNAAKPVKITIKNIGTTAVTGPFNASYTYGSTIITEPINTTIAAGATYTYTFAGTYPQPATGYQYNFKAWVTHLSDPNHLNDTAYKTVKYINNDAITSMPVTESFESMPAADYTASEMAIGGNKNLDFITKSLKGRARTFVNTGFAFSGNQALTLDQFPTSITTSADSAVLNYNLSNYTAKQLRFDFYYKNHGQADAPGNRVWIRGSENNNWIEAYNLFTNQGNIGEWKKAIVNINEILNSAIPSQTVTPTFQIKLGQEGNTSANSVNPIQDVDDGYTFDNLVLNEAVNDVAVLSILSPQSSGCGLSAENSIKIVVKNYNNTALNNLTVSYQVNGGNIVNETIPSIAANQAMDFTFSQTADFSSYINYAINAWVHYPADNYSANDSVLNYLVHSSPVINTYPYLESFENSDGYFYSTGSINSWQWGTPAKAIMNKAADGTMAWVTNLSGNYSNDETSYLVSPCFDLNGLRRPVLSFSHIFDVEQDYDFTWVEYSTDGKTWNKLGTAGSGTNWYDNSPVNNWRLSNSKWHVASIDIPVTNTTIRFRFVMSADGGVTQEGVGIDEVRVHEKTDIPTFVAEPPGISANVSGSDWISFTWGDSLNGPFYKIAEINAGGQDLGTVTITPYLGNRSAVRNSNNQFYADRNYVIKSSAEINGEIKIRLYFTDGEANALINATNCNTCGAVGDAYELGVEKYRGNSETENGILEDNYNNYRFILPGNVVKTPHGNGYYAEFSTSDLGEFWICKGDIAPLENSTCQGGNISFFTAQAGNSIQWQEDRGSGFIDVRNDLNYSGANTNSLLLTNMPGIASGYQYRCVVDGTNSATYTLRFKNVWLGNADTNWFNAANWLCGTVPDAFTDVVIPSDKPNYPILTGGTKIRSIRMLSKILLQIEPGVTLEILGK